MSSVRNEFANPLKVQYRKAGKTYNVPNGDQAGFDSEDRTSYPFDELEVAVGESVELNEVEILNIVELKPLSEATQKSLDSFIESSSLG